VKRAFVVLDPQKRRDTIMENDATKLFGAFCQRAEVVEACGGLWPEVAGLDGIPVVG